MEGILVSEPVEHYRRDYAGADRTCGEDDSPNVLRAHPDILFL